MPGLGEKKTEKWNKTKEKPVGLPSHSPHLKFGGRLFSGLLEDRKLAGPSLMGKGTKLMG